ncbi:MAG: trigger factor [Nitrospinaceae bacterium]
MELDVEELEGLKRKLKITIPEEVVSQKVDRAYKELNRQIRMPGFRPGKIPQRILEKQVPIQSFTQMFQEMMQDYYEKALRELGITPAGQPEIENTELENIRKDAPFRFSVILDIKPELEIKNYKGLKFKKREIRIGDEELEAAVRGILSRYGHLEHRKDEHEVEKGDHLLIDFEGFLDGRPLEEGSAKDYRVRVGEKKMIEGFEDQLIGHKLGEEFEIKVRLPANWNNRMRRVSLPVPGAAPEKQEDDRAAFQVKIKEIKKLVLPELTDEIAGKIGFDTVDKFRGAVKSDLQAYQEQQEELKIKEEIFNKLVKENPVNPPEALVKRELKFMVEGMKFQIEQSGMKVEDSGFDPDKAVEEWRERAEFNTKGYMILEAIAAKENIHVTQSDLDEEYKKLAEQTKNKVEEVKARMMANPDTMGQTNSKILGQKAMNFIYSHSEFEYVKDSEDKKDQPAEKENA